MAQDLKFERVGSVFAYKIFEANEDIAHENYKNCYTALSWIFSPKVCALIGFLEVTWHPTIGLFPAKISRAGNTAQQNL